MYIYMCIYIILVYKFFLSEQLFGIMYCLGLWAIKERCTISSYLYHLVSMYFLDLFRPVGLWAKKKRCTKLYIVADLVAAKPTFSQGV